MSQQMALAPVAVGSEDAYIRAAYDIPMLSAEEEHELAVSYRQREDLDAARRLVLSHLRFVVYIARGYSGYGLALSDLIQEGNVGLMKAVKRFDPGVNVRLVSFAVHWIRAEIHEFILRNWRIVKVATTKAQRKLFFNLRSAKKRLGWLTQSEVNAVAKDLGVKAETVLEMESRMAGHDVAFDASPDEDQGDEHTPRHPIHYLADANADPAKRFESDDWEEQNVDRMQNALASLDARSRDIIERRWLADDKATLETLAETYSVSAERIRQLEQSAMKKLRQAVAS